MSEPITLIESYVGTVHKPGCYTIKGKKPYRQFAGIEESEIAAFLEARKITGCGSCFPITVRRGIKVVG